MMMPFSVRAAYLALFCLLCIGGFLLSASAMPQSPEYHNFADQRPLLGMPHMLNVVSNLPFLVVGLWMLAPLVGLGIASVLYWHFTEAQNAGDLRFYIVVQYFPLLALPLLFLLFRPRYTGTGDLVASLSCYGIAKVLELLDAHIYAQG